MSAAPSRRAILAGIAASPALAAPIAAAIVTPALAAPATANSPLDPDAELRRLWLQYCAELDAYTAACAVHEPRRAALDQDVEQFHRLDREAADPYSPWGGWQGWRDAQEAAFKKAWCKHKVGGPWRTMEKCADKCRKTIAAIRSIDARTPFGIGIKLAALPADTPDLDVADYVEALQSALPDLDKLCGGTFAKMPAVQS
jgi:hypothetical protein